jgi:hypothetical protein
VVSILIMQNKQLYNSFTKNGFIKLDKAVPIKTIEEYTANTIKFLNEPHHQKFLKSFGNHIYFPRTECFSPSLVCPKIWNTIEFLVGEKNILRPVTWGNGFVAARPKSSTENKIVGKDSWHKDGFFRHFVDSPEIGIVCIILWTDVGDNCGATEVALNSVKVVAKSLLNNLQGLDPDYFENLLPKDCPSTKLTGKKGDAYLLHPFLLHSRSLNYCKYWRLITNPVVQLKKPLFTNKNELSPLEESILKSLGLRHLEVRIKGKREALSGNISQKLVSSREKLMQLLINNKIGNA